MHKSLLLTICLLLSTSAFCFDDFKVKIEVSTINHASPSGAVIQVTEKGKEVKSEVVSTDGKIKLQLEKGRLYEIWISQKGYLPHVIHNVHDEGKGKFDVILFKPTKKITADKQTYQGVARTFVDVKKMTIPAEYLAEGVLVVKKDALSEVEVVNQKAMCKLAKKQQKAQSKIDSLIKKRDKVESKIEDAEAELASGDATKVETDSKKLKLQKTVVKLNDKITKLAY